MERLTPRVQNAYPVERTIMETGSEGVSSAITKRKTPQVRMAEIVARFNQKERDKRQNPARKNEDKEENVSASGGAGGGRFDIFNPEMFKKNRYLKEVAKEVSDAIANGKATPEFLQKKRQEVIGQVGRGVSENWAWNFVNQLSKVEISQRLNQPQDDVRELISDVETIVAQRKSSGLTVEQVQASRAAMELAFGRKLTEAELQRATLGTEKAKGKVSETFEAQMKTLEALSDNSKKYEAFLKALSAQSPDVIKKALSGSEGKLVLGVLLGDVIDHEKFFAKLDEILKKDPGGVVASLPMLVAEIKAEEARESVKVDPERQRIAREQAEKWLKEQKQKRQVTAEEIDALFNNAERGIPVIAGGADFYEVGLNLLESIDSVPDEAGEAFNVAKANLVDDERITLLAEDMYGVNSPRIREETERFSNIRNIDDPKIFKQRYRQFLNDLLKRYQETMNDPKREIEEKAQVQKDVEELVATKEKNKGGKTFNIQGIEEIAEAVSPQRPGERPFFEREPKHIKELAVWIMAGDDRSIWGPDGVYPVFKWGEVIDSKTGRREAEFQAHNLIRWLRNKALEHHGDNPNDPLNLLNGISIETLFKSISILQMKYQKQKYFADEHGRPLSNLADEVINEAWLFGVRRNKNLGYIQAMNSDEKLFEAIVEMSGKNDHTGGKNLANHFQMGENFSDADKNKDNMVGDAMLAANQIYRNISDFDKLRQILPEKSPLFTVDGFKNASRYLNGQGFDEETKGFGNLKIEGKRVYFLDPRTKIRTEIFTSDGELVSDGNLIKFLNFFPEATPQESNETFVRELAKQSIAEIVGFDSGMDRKKYEEFLKDRKNRLGDAYKEVDIEEYRKIMRMNLEWAETNSWVEQRWNGAAARNDTGYRGYDAWTKMYAQYYRERQSGPRTAGPVGNPHDMQIFRLLSPDMWLAIRTESGESVHEVFEELHMANLQLYQHAEGSPEREALKKRKEAAYEKLRFPRWTETDWASNGVKRQSEVWHNIMNTEDLKFNELAKRDTWGVLRYDRQKFEEVVKDDFIKKRRYAFSSNNAMNYGAVTRMRLIDSIDENDNPVFKYKDLYMAEAMFGEVVIGSIRRDWFEGKLEYESADEDGKKIIKKGPKKGEEFNPEKHGTFQGYLNSLPARERILKNVCRAGIAAQIKAHRERAGTTERWDSATVRKLYQSLQSMPKYIEDPVTGEERKIDDSQFFSDEDIEWIREQTATGKGQLLWEDSYHAGWDMFAGGLPDILKLFYQDIVS